MALVTYNGTNYDAHLGSAAYGGTNVNLSLTGASGTGKTAPNTTNKVTGIWIAVFSLPNSPNNIKVELLESGVSKVTLYINRADIKGGPQYVRLPTPYQFTTTAANAYNVKLSTTSTNSGSVRADGSGTLWFILTYDTAAALGATDDIMVGGFHNSGLTTTNFQLNHGHSSGGATDKTIGSTTVWTMGCAIHVCNGANVTFDQTTNVEATLKGSVIVYNGGVFDKRPGTGYTATLTFNQDGADGNFGIISPTSGYGGQILTTGESTTVGLQYLTGVGTAIAPVEFKTAHGLSVGQELIFPGLNYSSTQVRFVESVVDTTRVTLSATIGGAISAITNTPAQDCWVSNVTRTSIIKCTNTAHGFWIFNSNTNATPVSDFRWTRMEYANCQSGKGININGGSTTVLDANDADFTGLVIYNNSANGRNSVTWYGKAAQSVTDVVLYNTKGSNYAAQSGLVFQSSNKTAQRVYHYAEPGSTTNCAGISFSTSSVKNRVVNFHSYGANAGNGSLGYAIGYYGSNNTVENSSVNGARVCAIRAETATGMVLNSLFGTIANNTITLNLASSTLNQINFLGCYSSDTTRVSNYTNTLDGTDIGFQDLDGNTSKHMWYTNKGVFPSAGSGLSDTTVRTAGSLSLAIKPENATDGAQFTFKIPAAPTSSVSVFGYIYRNATFSSGDIIVELFLPGNPLTGTPDATYTLPTTTLSWDAGYWALDAYYSGTVARYATVRATFKTATAGAIAFMDDVYDAQTLNKVAGFDLWDNGHISPVFTPTDFASAIPAIADASRIAVWSDDDTYSAGEKGYVLAFIEKLSKFLVGKK